MKSTYFSSFYNNFKLKFVLHFFYLKMLINLFSYRSVFLLLNWFGAFPLVYDQNKKLFVPSKCGLMITLMHIVIIGLIIQKYSMMLIFGTIKKTSAVSAIVFCTNGVGFMVLLLRRIIFVSDTVKCYNNLSEWPVNILIRRTSKFILYASSVSVLIEFIGDNIERYLPYFLDYVFKLHLLITLSLKLEI